MQLAQRANVSVARHQAAKPALPARAGVKALVVRAQQQAEAKLVQAGKVLAAVAAASTLIVAEQAQASVEVAQVAAGDNRAALLATLLVPALGWVGFNIFGPLQNQLKAMDDAKGVAGAVGVGAVLSMLLAEQAQAASEVAQIAAADGRIGIIGTLFVPALGWVAFNIFGPLQNQIKRMDEERGIAGAVGLGAAASMLFAEQAQAASEIMTLAESDNRIAIIGTLFVPALGWVAFNIFGPLQNQIKRMDDER